MKIKNAKLEWYAIEYDDNEKKIQVFNVFWCIDKEEIAKLVRKKEIYDLLTLKTYLNREFMYHYWSKCEHEILVGDMFEEDINKFEKIDVYYQLKPNLNRIVEYVNREMQLRLR